MDGISECLCYYRMAQDPKQQTLANFDFNDIYMLFELWNIIFILGHSSLLSDIYQVKNDMDLCMFLLLDLWLPPITSVPQSCKINQQLAHFIVCSEKCPSCSKCLWLNFEHKRMTLCYFLCITIWSLKIFLKGSITLNTLTGQNI